MVLFKLCVCHFSEILNHLSAVNSFCTWKRQKLAWLYFFYSFFFSFFIQKIENFHFQTFPPCVCRERVLYCDWHDLSWWGNVNHVKIASINCVQVLNILNNFEYLQYFCVKLECICQKKMYTVILIFFLNVFGGLTGQ